MNDGRNRGLDIRERKQRENDCVNWNQSRKAILNLQACYPGRTLEVRICLVTSMTCRNVVSTLDTGCVSLTVPNSTEGGEGLEGMTEQ
jgi:hypothetical protein